MRVSIHKRDPGYRHDIIGGYQGTNTNAEFTRFVPRYIPFVDGVRVNKAQTVDEERGQIDGFWPFGHPIEVDLQRNDAVRGRIFGNVQIERIDGYTLTRHIHQAVMAWQRHPHQ